MENKDFKLDKPLPIEIMGAKVVTLKGAKGDKGDSYILTDQDKTEIAKTIKVPVVEKVIERTEVIHETPIVTENVVEKAVADPGEVIVDKINELPIEADFQIDASHIKNLPTPEIRTYGGGLSKMTADTLYAPIGDLANYLKLDGTSTTTTTIPFAQGITIPENKRIYFAGSNNYITDDGEDQIRIVSEFLTFEGGALFGGTLNLRSEVGGPSLWFTVNGDTTGDDGFLKWDNVTGFKTIQLPNASGTVALTSDIVNLLPLNNTWTGTNLFKTTGGSTTAFQIQDNSANVLLVADTTNFLFGLGGATDSTSLINITNANQLNSIKSNRTISTKPSTNTFEFTSLVTANWTGTDSAGPRIFFGSLLDSRTINGAGTNTSLLGMQFTVNRTSSYSNSANFVVTTGVLYGVQMMATDSGSYTSSGTQSLLAAGSLMNMTWSATINKSGATMNATPALVRGTLATSPTITAGTLNLNASCFEGNITGTPVNSGTLNSFTYGVWIKGTAHNVGTTPFAAGLYTSLGGSGKVFSLYSDSAKDAFAGGDNALWWFGTGAKVLGTPDTTTTDVSVGFTGSEFQVISDNITSTDSILLRAGTNGLKLNIGATQQAILTSALLTFKDTFDIAVGTGTGTKWATSNTQKQSWWNATPVVQDTGWTTSNVTTDRVLDANSTSLDEVADVLATLIETLKTYGILGA